MTRTQEEFLRILRAALRGERTETELSDAELPELFETALKQHLLPMVAEAVPGAFERAQGNELIAEYRSFAIRQTVSEAAHSLDFRALYRCLRREGLHPIVMKGELCRRLYPWSYHRISADNDMHIAADEFPACHRALLAYGLSTEVADEQLEHSDEVTYRDADGRFYIELHRHLFDTSGEAPDDLNAFFTGLFAAPAEIGGLLAMPPHEHLLYLLLHAYKHFIYSGVGIRQTCDIALWAREYAGEIDWPLLLVQCRLVHAERFAAAQFGIAAQHLGCPLPLPECWQDIGADTEPMLADMFSGGVYGSDSLTRLHTSTVTLNAIRKSRAGESSGILRSIFPTREYMEGRFPYLRKHPALLPAAWAGRIFGYLKELGQDDSSSASGSLRLARERIELLKHYGVID